MDHPNKNKQKKIKETGSVAEEKTWIGEGNLDTFFKTLDELSGSSISAAITREERKLVKNERNKTH